MNNAQSPARPADAGKYRLVAWLLLSALLLYRVAGVLNEPRLEDHDSAAYLIEIAAFGSLDAARIHNTLTADSLPLYPAAAGIGAALGVAPEAAGRAASLLASALMAVAVVLAAARLGSWAAGAAAAMFLAFEPTLARFSYAVLTEPLFSGLIAAGLWLTLVSVRTGPTIASAAGLGLIFGLSFLCRLEGVLFLAAIPLMLWCVALARKDVGRPGQLKRLVACTTVFAAVFVAIAAPQVWDVSKRMNRFALNGRQAWSVVVNAGFADTWWERVYGLNYSPSATNIVYLTRSPAELARLAETVGVGTQAKLIAHNLDDLQRKSLPALIGLSALVFVPLGFLYLLRNGKGAEAFVLASFIAVALVAPLIYNPEPRHILATAPPLIVLAGLGLVGAGTELAGLGKSPRWTRWSLPALFSVVLLATAVASVAPLARQVARPDGTNDLADRALYAPFIPQLSSACRASPDERLLAVMDYLPLYSGCPGLSVPYASLAQLRVFAELNDATLLYVDTASGDSLLPFYSDLTESPVPPEGFTLLATHTRPDGQRQFLYRLTSAMAGHRHPDEARSAP